LFFHFFNVTKPNSLQILQNIPTYANLQNYFITNFS